jgi:hypothetical protein
MRIGGNFEMRKPGNFGMRKGGRMIMPIGGGTSWLPRFQCFVSLAKNSINGELLLDAAKRIGEYGPIPIVTSEELAWQPRE